MIFPVASSQSESPIDKNARNKMDYRPLHYRSRTLSLYSTASGTSSRSSLSLTTQLSHATSPTPRLEREAEAWGSFVPSTSARHSLHQLISPTTAPKQTFEKKSGRREQAPRPVSVAYSYSSHPTSTPRSLSKPIRATASVGFPVIARTSSTASSPSLSSSPGTSTSSSSASSINIKLERKPPTSSELHPVLARLERTSKLCGQKMGCATCHKPGRDYPQCGKCKKMWCSRECRLVGGKRHVC